MTVLITLTLAGSDVGPFNLYSNVDGYTIAFETGVSRAALLAGYTSTLVPSNSTEVLARSTGVCSRDLYMPIEGAFTTTTTTTTSSTTTTTTTLHPDFIYYSGAKIVCLNPNCAGSTFVTVKVAYGTGTPDVTKFYPGYDGFAYNINGRFPIAPDPAAILVDISIAYDICSDACQF
jgi:hypothetical protein